MGTAQTVLLAAIAGFTIFLGLPVGRIRFKRSSTKLFLSGISAGVLVFLLMETLHAATEGVETAFDTHDFGAGFARLAVYLGAFGLGLLSMLWFARRAKAHAGLSHGPGAMAATDRPARNSGDGPSPSDLDSDAASHALHLGLSIAIGIGLHNFSEGLAIGASSASGEVRLAVLLVVGFALHNATEGFGIVGPLAAADVRPSWRWLGGMGLIAGGPTFVGALVGGSFDNALVSLGFLAAAAGAILYVIGELIAMGKRANWSVTLWGVFAGVALAAATEMIIAAAGL